MSKPAPTILREKNSGIKSIQVVMADGMYAVLFENKPFNLRTVANTHCQDIVPPKYSKTLFVNKGYALATARRLNKLFESSDFTVMEINN